MSSIEEINLIKGAEENIGRELTEPEIDKFTYYYKEVIRENKNINLTSIISEKEFIIKNILDSIIILGETKFNDNSKIIDIGTGAGLPGIPLKILCKRPQIDLCDSNKKKCKFLNDLVNKLELGNIRVFENSIENISRNSLFRESYDFVLARALAKMPTLLEYGIPLLKKGGIMILYKGPSFQQEINESENAMRKLNSKIIKIKEYLLPGTDIKRTIIIVEKLWKTENIYPRLNNNPRKKPL
jgi:16S rRNA (guanine527-N7)-methyltransferase